MSWPRGGCKGVFVRVCWGCLGGALGRSGEVVYGCGVYFSFEGEWSEADFWVVDCDS